MSHRDCEHPVFINPAAAGAHAVRGVRGRRAVLVLLAGAMAISPVSGCANSERGIEEALAVVTVVGVAALAVFCPGSGEFHSSGSWDYGYNSCRPVWH